MRKLHLVLAIRIYFDKNLNYFNPGQIKITSQVPNLLNMFKTKYISNATGNTQIFVISFSFYKHNLKLKAEVSID